jgi:hypothetical protein
MRGNLLFHSARPGTTWTNSCASTPTPMSNCRECGHLTESIRDIGSAVCTNCGTLVDSSQQSALTSSTDFLDVIYTPSNYSRPTTLKSIRRNPTWDLQGQGTNSRKERNKVILFVSLSLVSTDRSPPLSSSLSMNSSAPLPTVWDNMVQDPAPKRSLILRCSVLPSSGVKQPNLPQARLSCLQ